MQSFGGRTKGRTHVPNAGGHTSCTTGGPKSLVFLAENGLADGLAAPRDSPNDCSFVARCPGLRERGHDTAARIEQSSKSQILHT